MILMNNKKITTLFILIATLTLIGIVGFTIAYFTSSTDFENEFNTGLYQTSATEVFESPQNWMPGDTTPKTLTITNTGSVDVKARVCITKDEWESANGTILPNEINGERISIINLDNTDEWTKKGNCYEYNEVLEPNDTTSSFIQSVTFNPNVVMPEADVTCTTTTNNNQTTKVCSSSGEGLSGATYTLKLTVETVQANKASELWPPIIQYVNRQTENQITVGDEISIAGEHFYVVSSDQNDTVLLAKYNLLVGDVYEEIESTWTKTKTMDASNTEGYGLQSETAKGSYSGATSYIGIVAFSGKGYWDNAEYKCNGTSCSSTGTGGLKSEYANSSNAEGTTSYTSPYPYVYRSNIGNDVEPQYAYASPWGYAQDNGYTIAYYVEHYVGTLKGLGAPNTITGRLLSYEEVISLSGTIKGNWSYWLGSGASNSILWFVNRGSIGSAYSWIDNNIGVRPVIEIPTSELN